MSQKTLFHVNYVVSFTVKPLLMATFKKTENWSSRLIIAILSTFIKLPFVIKIFGLSIFEWSFYTGFTAASFRKLLLRTWSPKP